VYSRAEIAEELLSQRFQNISFFATETWKFKLFNRLRVTSKIKRDMQIAHPFKQLKNEIASFLAMTRSD